jgi:hypothetical protein
MTGGSGAKPVTRIRLNNQGLRQVCEEQKGGVRNKNGYRLADASLRIQNYSKGPPARRALKRENAGAEAEEADASSEKDSHR